MKATSSRRQPKVRLDAEAGAADPLARLQPAWQTGAGPRPMSPVAVAAGTAGPDPTLRPRSTLAWVLFAFHVLPLVLVMSEVGLLGELKALR